MEQLRLLLADSLVVEQDPLHERHPDAGSLVLSRAAFHT
jgi:hypothetical protein